MKLEVKDASIGYKKQVLSSNINMASEPGMVTAILGQNGCGKTTFVKSLMKLYHGAAEAHFWMVLI